MLTRPVPDRPLARGGTAKVAPRRSQLPPLMGVLVLVTLCLWVYIIARAVDVPFTVDEAGSYLLFHGFPTGVNSANNQWLNTVLMQFSQTLFGQAEWALRLPNLLAFLVFGGSSLWLVRALRTTSARLLCFALLLSDPFMLEFFGLARGYGMSVAFSCAALVVLLTFPLNGSGTRAMARLGLVGALAAIGFYANFSVLNYVLALLAGAVLDTVIRSFQGRLTMTRRHWMGFVAVGAAILGGLMPGVLQVVYLNDHLQLYYVGVRGFVPDTVGTLVMTWGYVYRYVKGTSAPHWALTGAWIVAAVGLLALLYALVSLLRRRWGPIQVVAVVLVISALAVILEHSILGTLWPIDRTALSYILLFAALLALVVDDVVRRLSSATTRRVLTGAGTVVLLLAFANVIRVANLTQALTWPTDVSARAAIDGVMAVERQRGTPPPPMTLAVVWPRENALEYYKIRFHLTWLNIVWLETAPTPIRFPRSAFLDEVPSGDPVRLPRNAYPLGRVPPDNTELWENPLIRRVRTNHRVTGRRSGRSRRA